MRLRYMSILVSEVWFDVQEWRVPKGVSYDTKVPYDITCKASLRIDMENLAQLEQAMHVFEESSIHHSSLGTIWMSRIDKGERDGVPFMDITFQIDITGRKRIKFVDWYVEKSRGVLNRGF